MKCFTLSLTQDQLKTSIKCIVVSSDEKAIKRKLRELINLSIVPAEKELFWENMTSAIEVPLIEYLKKELESPILTTNMLKDFKTVIRRIQMCSAFNEIRAQQKIYRISEEMKKVLKKYMIYLISNIVFLWDFSIIL